MIGSNMKGGNMLGGQRLVANLMGGLKGYFSTAQITMNRDLYEDPLYQEFAGEVFMPKYAAYGPTEAEADKLMQIWTTAWLNYLGYQVLEEEGESYSVILDGDRDIGYFGVNMYARDSSELEKNITVLQDFPEQSINEHTILRKFSYLPGSQEYRDQEHERQLLEAKERHRLRLLRMKAEKEARSSPKAPSPKRPSPKAASPKRASPKRESPKRASPKAASPKRASPKRESPMKFASFKEHEDYHLKKKCLAEGKSECEPGKKFNMSCKCYKPRK